MKQKITQMRLVRYLFTAVLALLFVNCSKGHSADEPKSNNGNGEHTTSSKQVEDEISPNDYELRDDSLTLAIWQNYNTKNLDMNRDPHLRKIRFIGRGAFAQCRSLTSINISSSVTSIGEVAFSGCRSLTSVDIPNSVTSIGMEAFSNCSSLTKVNIPGSVTSIGESAFKDCSSLTSINIPNSVTSIGVQAFAYCSSLINITIPRSVTNIDILTFKGCHSLTSVDIPISVRSIGEGAFIGCSNLTSINIPSSVTSIGTYPFNGCSRLTRVIFKGNNPPKISSSNNIFLGTPSNLKLIVPKGAKSAYIGARYPADKLVEE